MMDKGLTNLTIAHDLIYLHIYHFEDLNERQTYVRGLVEHFVDFVHTINGRKITDLILKDEINRKKVIKKVGEHVSDMIQTESSQDVLIDMISICEQKDIQKYILKTIRGNMDTFCNTKQFDLFVCKLIEKNQFEYLKEKFLKEVTKQ